MARIAGVDLPKEKRVEIGLTYIYGIGRSAADEILAATKINPDTRVKDLTKDEEALIRDYIDKNFTVEGDLRRNTALDIKRLVEIQCYRGTRHRKGLPGARPAFQNERPYPQRSEAHCSQQEEVIQQGGQLDGNKSRC